MSRLDQQPDLAERKAASAIVDLAGAIQDLCYQLDARGIPPATVREMHKAYRALMPVVTFYHGPGLFRWSPPDYRFKAKHDKPTKGF